MELDLHGAVVLAVEPLQDHQFIPLPVNLQCEESIPYSTNALNVTRVRHSEVGAPAREAHHDAPRLGPIDPRARALPLARSQHLPQITPAACVCASTCAAAVPTARAQTHIGRMRDNASGSRLAWVCRRRRGVTHSCAMTDTPPKAPQVKGTARRALCGADGRAQPRRAAGDRRGPALAWRTRTPSSPVHSLKAYRSA